MEPFPPLFLASNYTYCRCSGTFCLLSPVPSILDAEWRKVIYPHGNALLSQPEKVLFSPVIFSFILYLNACTCFSLRGKVESIERKPRLGKGANTYRKVRVPVLSKIIGVLLTVLMKAVTSFILSIVVGKELRTIKKRKKDTIIKKKT